MRKDKFCNDSGVLAESGISFLISIYLELINCAVMDTFNVSDRN